MDQYQKLKEIIHSAQKLVIFTGAGISVPSGIPDFRSQNGLYNTDSENDYSPEEIISHSFFLKYPKKFYNFYKKKISILI